MIELGDIFRHFGETMSSAAFAEAGEFEMARQLAARGKNAHKTVLLGTDRPELDMKIVDNALKLCQRIGAGLEILHVLPAGSTKGRQAAKRRSAAKSARSEQATLRQQGISYQTVAGVEPLEEEIVKHAGSRRDILCVVLGTGQSSAGAKGRVSGRAKRTWLFDRLKCPVVMYAEAESAAT